MYKVVCPYCKEIAPLTDSVEVYGKSYGKIYLCKPCDAYVGVHKNSEHKGYAPLGTPANKKLRNLRKMDHAIFDPLWERKMARELCSKKEARKAGYKWISESLSIPFEDCHIGQFNEEQCADVIVLCTPFYDSKKERMARCSYYGKRPKGQNHGGYWCNRGEICKCERPSTEREDLPFFGEKPDKEYDEFYCGCFGWN